MNATPRRIAGCVAIDAEQNGVVWLTALPTMHSSATTTDQLLEQLEDACLAPDCTVGIDLSQVTHITPDDRARLLARGRQLNPYALAVVVRSRAAQIAAMLGHAIQGGRLPLRIFNQAEKARAWLLSIHEGRRILA